MTDEASSRRFGIRVELPDNDPMRAGHLLGEDWAAMRWFDSEEARDRAFDGMLNQPGYYRKGDSPSVQLVENHV